MSSAVATTSTSWRDEVVRRVLAGERRRDVAMAFGITPQHVSKLMRDAGHRRFAYRRRARRTPEPPPREPERYSLEWVERYLELALERECAPAWIRHPVGQ